MSNITTMNDSYNGVYISGCNKESEKWNDINNAHNIEKTYHVITPAQYKLNACVVDDFTIPRSGNNLYEYHEFGGIINPDCKKYLKSVY